MAKSKVIPVRLDPGAWDLIQRVAAASGRTASGYLRHVAVQAAVRDDHSHPVVRAERRRLEEATAPLNRRRLRKNSHVGD